MSYEPSVSIIILNWNGWQDTLKCIKSLEALRYKNYKIIVVDNASTDKSAEIIKSTYPDIEMLISPSNLGFGGGNNIGIEQAIKRGAEYIWLLNNDTTVGVNSLTSLIGLAETDKNIGAVGSCIFDSEFPYNIQAWGGGKVSFFLGITRHLKSSGQPDYLTAASLLIKTATMQSVGGFDNKFFMYWEDVDLSIRIKKLGFTLAVAGSSRIYHKDSASLGKENPLMDAYYNYSATKFFMKHSTVGVIPIIIGSMGRVLKRLHEGNKYRAKVVILETLSAWVDKT